MGMPARENTEWSIYRVTRLDSSGFSLGDWYLGPSLGREFMGVPARECREFVTLLSLRDNPGTWLMMLCSQAEGRMRGLHPSLPV